MVCEYDVFLPGGGVMAEYIEREAVSAAMPDDYYGWRDKQILNFIPAADVVPVRRGRWEKATGMMPPEYCGLHICSECGHYAGRKPPYGGREMLSDYCPNCGARMDGDA